MISSISKKYTKALTASLNTQELKELYESLEKISQALKVSKFHDILGSKDIAKEQKSALIEQIAGSNQPKLKNLISVLLKANRVEIVPAISEELREYLAAKSGKASGKITASFELSGSEIEEISKALSSKLKRELELTFEKTDVSSFNGIKVEINDLGVEVEINKDALKKSVIAHILNTTKIF